MMPLKHMSHLADRHGFRVSVILAPAAAWLYWLYFEDYPRVSDEPYFLDCVSGLSQKQGFAVVDLFRLMKPYVKNELFYWRGDGHWNEPGNDLVSELIAEHIFSLDIEPTVAEGER